jgi:diguanylate cyclase (GGDEF)-like protein
MLAFAFSLLYYPKWEYARATLQSEVVDAEAQDGPPDVDGICPHLAWVQRMNMTAMPPRDLSLEDQAPGAGWQGSWRASIAAGPDCPAIPDLEARVEALLKLPLRKLALPPDIAALYRQRTRNGARKMMFSWCLCVGIGNIPCAALDILILPPALVPIVLSFRLVISFMFLFSALLLNAGQLVDEEPVAIILPTLATMLLAGAAGLMSPGQLLLEHYLINATVVAYTVITFVRLDKSHVRSLALGALLILLGSLVLSAHRDIAEKLQTVTFYSVVMLALLYGQTVQNIYRYRVFLTNTRDELRNAAVTRRNNQLTSIAYTDPLTGIPNRRYFEEICASVSETTRNLLPLSICLLDVDHFKNLNDRLGHLQGDRCLRMIATAIRNNLRGETDILARYGGEEFVLLLPATTGDAAYDVIERIRIAVMALNHPNPGMPVNIVTISAGIAVATNKLASIEALLNEADKALYRAKSSGRNRVAS